MKITEEVTTVKPEILAQDKHSANTNIQRTDKVQKHPRQNRPTGNLTKR